MRVLVTQPIFEDSLELLTGAGLEVEEAPEARPLTADELAATCVGADAVVTQLTDQVSREVFEANPRLRLVANVATGFDNIDIDAARRTGVQVTNTPGVLTAATADLAISLILAVARRVPEGDRMLRRGEYEGWRLKQHPMGLDVTGTTLGVIGMGRVGEAVARRAHRGFDMQVLYVDHGPDGLASEQEADLGAHRVELDHLLAHSDFISLHAPLTADTRHLIDAAALESMKPTAVLVNTARGPLVDEHALAAALRDGRIAGAGLDVFEAEPDVVSGLLELHERVVLTPHVGSATESTRRRMSEMAAENVIAVLAGRPALNPVG